MKLSPKGELLDYGRGQNMQKTPTVWGLVPSWQLHVGLEDCTGAGETLHYLIVLLRKQLSPYTVS